MRALAASAYRHGAKFVDVGWFDPHVKRARIEHARPDTLDFVPPWYGERVLALGEQRGASIALSGSSAPGLLADLDPALVGKDRLPAVKEGIRVVNDRTTELDDLPLPDPGLGRPGLRRPRRGRAARAARAGAAARAAARRGGPDRGLEGARRHARRHRRADLGSPLRRVALRGSRDRPDDRPAALLGLARRALPDRRRDRAHAQPPDRGGLHLARSRAHAGHGDLDEAARAVRRDRRARPRRPLRRAGGSPTLEASEGGETLRTIIGTDDGGARLGEVALVDREGRIGELGTIFYDTLLDENAASHIALGQGFPFLLDEEDRDRCNESEIHIDFMIGSNELTVTGLTREGDRVPLLSEGRWQV